MRFFTLLDFQYISAALFCGLGFLLVVYLAWAGYPPRSSRRDPLEPEEREEFTLENGHGGEENPVVPLLIFVYIGIAIWAVAYMVTIGIRGTAF